MVKTRMFAAGIATSFLWGMACTGHGTGRSELRPARPFDSLANEVGRRHKRIIESIVTGDTARLSPHLSPGVVVITPSGDSVKGISAASQLFAGYDRRREVLSMRTTTMSGATRCTDGIFERREEWSLELKGSDSSAFLQGAFRARWIAEGDSLRLSFVDLRTGGSISERSIGCVNAERFRHQLRRVEILYAAGMFSPLGYTKDVEAQLRTMGFSESNPEFASIFGYGRRVEPPQTLTAGVRLAPAIWLSTTQSLKTLEASTVRCRAGSTPALVRLERRMRPSAYMLDARSEFFFLGAGLAVTSDAFAFRRAEFPLRCGTLARTETDAGHWRAYRKGLAANIGAQLPMGPWLSLTARAQFFRFPNVVFPRLSDGTLLVIPDRTLVFGIGLSLNY